MIVTVIEGYNLIVYGAAVPLLVTDSTLGVTSQQTGLIGGTVYLGAMVGALLAPILSSMTRGKTTLVLGITVFGLGALAFALSVNAPTLAASRLVNGFGVGTALATAMTIARDNAPAERAALVVTVTMAGVPLGGVAASLIAIPVLPALGWRALFFIGAGLSLLVLFVVGRTPIPAADDGTAGRDWTGRRKLAALFSGGPKWIALLVATSVILCMVAWQGLNVWATQAMVDLGFSLDAALVLTFALTGAAVAGSFLSAWAADRLGSALVAIATGACTVLGLAGILVLPTTFAVAAICVALMGIGGHSTMNLVHTTASGAFPVPARAAALGWSNGTSFIGAFAGPTLGGVVIAAGGSGALFGTFAVAAALCLVSVGGLFLVRRRLPGPGTASVPVDIGLLDSPHRT
ncbi:aromatic acid/H+ symport family MFS transporter [Amycolatopsis acidicola]|uniref:Aromatic acid/H+ symport family MFS transporter n=2 Tax=Amycolatopsis acidicola TaxID=2596893 RepID=A0A5N0V318_9PSEU|nr:aromatic acid/H+ symport family MFS transporter [Amycolatopsis acidicola]